MKKHLKTILIVLIVIAVVLAVGLIGWNIYKNYANGNPESSNVENKNTRLAKYFGKIKDSYYMKYKTNTLDANNKEIEATFEEAINGNQVAVNSEELGISMVMKEDKIYYIAHSEKSILVYPLTDELKKQFNVEEILKSDRNINETFIKGEKEELNGTEYYCESYNNKENKGTTKYYFDGNDVKFIKNSAEGESDQVLEVLEFSDKTRDGIFDIPSDYKQINI